MGDAESTLIINGALLDPQQGTIVPDQCLRIEGERIVEVGPAQRANGTRTIDARGQTVMPGLVDCHVHLIAASANLAQQGDWSPPYVTAHAARIAHEMLMRGFTTVRDAGGADAGLARVG